MLPFSSILADPTFQEAGKWIITSLCPFFWNEIKERIEKGKLEKKRKKISPIEFKNITDFWKAPSEGELSDGDIISIQGQLSKYTPMMIGPPYEKRQIHLKYRTKLQEGISSDKLAQANASLAYTAGQMVWRLNCRKQPLMFLGLYHSIVRNSIPVFVDMDYYQKSVVGIFRDNVNPFVIEADITGEVIKFKEGFMDDVPDSDVLKGSIRLDILEPFYGIIINGKNTNIEYVDEARYLDGDIWVALEKDEKQFFVSRFIDLADIDDLQKEKGILGKQVESKEYENYEVIFQFDQVDKIILTATKGDEIVKRFT